VKPFIRDVLFPSELFAPEHKLTPQVCLFRAKLTVVPVVINKL
jgi:hypothetical protein